MYKTLDFEIFFAMLLELEMDINPQCGGIDLGQRMRVNGDHLRKIRKLIGERNEWYLRLA